MVLAKASTSTPGSRTYTPTRLSTMRPSSAASLQGRGPDQKLPQLNPSSSWEEVEVAVDVGRLCVGVAAGEARPLVEGGVPLLLLLVEAGAVSGTVGLSVVLGSLLFRTAPLEGRRVLKANLLRQAPLLLPHNPRALLQRCMASMDRMAAGCDLHLQQLSNRGIRVHNKQ